MKLRNLIGAGIATLSLSTVGMTASSVAAVIDLEIQEAPPPARVEIVPAPREGYIYERGHYIYDGQRYAWREGVFIRNREGHRYAPAELEQHGDKWRFRAGHWDDD